MRGGIVTECAHSNISILKNGALFTHPTNCHILPGIAREKLIDACKSLKIPVFEQAFGVKALREADEILITSTSKICVRASHIAGHPVGMRNDMLANRIVSTLFNDFYNTQYI